MAEVIRMPKMSDTMEEGVIASWLKKEGDEVSSGDVLAEVETDKATMELESYQDGVLLHIGVKEKESVPVDGILAVIGEKGEDFKHLLEENGESSSNNGSEADEKESDFDNSKEAEDIDVSDVNASIIRMPKMSDTMEEGIISSWLKKVGDQVESGDILAEVETDKATMELEAYEDGELLYTAVEEGSGVPVDGVIAIVGEKGANYEALLKVETQSDSKTKKEENKQVEKEEKPMSVDASAPVVTVVSNAQSEASISSNGRIKASPLAKKIASDKGIDLAQVNGSGTDGRIVKKDVEEFNSSALPFPKLLLLLPVEH
ncbi:MAG: biotin/lipoyl-containing protein [Bacteroidota bacterium]